MDGVLVDSEPLHLRALKMTFATVGIMLTRSEAQANMGRSTRDFLKEVFNRHHITRSPDEVYRDHKRRLLQLYQKNVIPIDGALERIQDIRASGLKLALASSSDRDLIDTVLTKFSLHSTFHVVVSGEEVDRAKPYPDIFFKSAVLLELDPSECLVIEDSEAGVRAATTAGMICIGFQSPHSHSQNLNDAHIIVDRLSSSEIDRLVKIDRSDSEYGF